MQLICVLLFGQILFLVGQCGMDETIYSKLIRTKLINLRGFIIGVLNDG